jgi:hypothetical protein
LPRAVAEFHLSGRGLGTQLSHGPVRVVSATPPRAAQRRYSRGRPRINGTGRWREFSKMMVEPGAYATGLQDAAPWRGLSAVGRFATIVRGPGREGFPDFTGRNGSSDQQHMNCPRDSRFWQSKR